MARISFLYCAFDLQHHGEQHMKLTWSTTKPMKSKAHLHVTCSLCKLKRANLVRVDKYHWFCPNCAHAVVDGLVGQLSAFITILAKKVPARNIDFRPVMLTPEDEVAF